MSNFTANQGLPDPGQPKKNEFSLGKSCLGCAGIVIAFALLVGGCTALVNNSSSHEPTQVDETAAAQSACEKSIKNRLKAPATASFDDEVSGTNPYTVSGTVDSENSFGANLRSSFQCTVTADQTTVDYLE